jgi:hypothetical protein
MSSLFEEKEKLIAAISEKFKQNAITLEEHDKLFNWINKIQTGKDLMTVRFMILYDLNAKEVTGNLTEEKEKLSEMLSNQYSHNIISLEEMEYTLKWVNNIDNRKELLAIRNTILHASQSYRGSSENDNAESEEERRRKIVEASMTDEEIKYWSKMEYYYVAYDFIDNGNGELAMIMDPPPGDTLDEYAISDSAAPYARFIYDGDSNAILVRTEEQVVLVPIGAEKVRGLLEKIKTVLIEEMDGNKISNEYDAPVEIWNRPLPGPDPEAFRAAFSKQKISFPKRVI